MSVVVPETWAWNLYNEKPTAAVCIAAGWEREDVQLTAAECHDYAMELLDARDRLYSLAHPLQYDRMTNYSDARHRKPFLPYEWRRKFAPVGISTMEHIMHAATMRFREQLNSTSLLYGTRVIV